MGTRVGDRVGTRVGDRVKSLWELGLGTELSPCGN